MRSIDDLEVAGQRVLVRSDLNVPLDGERITDDGRIRASVPTIEALAARGARVVVCAHLGRPKGQVRPELSLRPVAHRLEEVLGRRVAFATDVVGDGAAEAVAGLADGEVALLENLRFEPGETSKDDAERAALAHRLAGLAELYVGDGFGAVHRKHASVYDVPQRLPHAAGGLVLAEVEVLQRLTTDPQRPYAVVLGGAKVSDKLGVIEGVLGMADRLVIGGGMQYTFLKALDYEIGRSLLEADQVDAVRGYLEAAREKGVEVVLADDIVIVDELAEGAESRVVPVDQIPADREGVDIGPRTRAKFAEKLADARTVFWNGPMGVFEIEPFGTGTRAVAQAISEIAGLSVVGGGDSAAAVRALGFTDDKFGHISTGGGASLEYLEGKTLPGLSALEQ
ncbi:MAG: phosphoglycerate kinase [Nocardioidaceae bacterium]